MTILFISSLFIKEKEAHDGSEEESGSEDEGGEEEQDEDTKDGRNKSAKQAAAAPPKKEKIKLASFTDILVEVAIYSFQCVYSYIVYYI